MSSLSIDPATHGCGAALWRRNGQLFLAEYIPSKTESENIVRKCAEAAEEVYAWMYGLNIDEPLETLIVELPQIYTRGANKTKGDPNKNVLPLAMINAALAAYFSDAKVVSYQPHAWKGTTKKPENTKVGEYVIMKRVKERLSESELAAVNWSDSVKHSWDVADAIGLGLHHLGRFERVQVFARE